MEIHSAEPATHEGPGGDPFAFIRTQRVREALRRGQAAEAALAHLEATAEQLNRASRHQPEGAVLHAASRGQPGGDFFRAFPGHRRTWLVLGDAAGNGPEASLLGAHYAAEIRQTLREAAGTPETALANAARQLMQWALEQEPLPHATVLLACLQDGIFHGLRLGHPPPVRFAAQGPEPVRSESLPALGIASTAIENHHHIRLPLGNEGEGIVMTTDGVQHPEEALQAMTEQGGRALLEQAMCMTRCVLRPQPLEKPGQDRTAAVLLSRG